MRRAAYALILLLLLAAGGYLLARALLDSDLIRSSLEQQLAARLGQPVRIGAARAAVFPRAALDLDDVTIGAPPGVRLGTVRIVTGWRGLLARTIDDAELIVSDSRLTLPLPFPLLPPAAPPPEGAPAGEPAVTVTSVRRIALRNVALAGGGREIVIDLDGALDGDRLEISGLTARAGTTTIEGHGELSSVADLPGRFEARADRLDVAEMLAIGSALTAPAAGGAADAAGGAALPSLRLALVLTAPAGEFGAYAFQDLSMHAEVTAGRFTLAPVAVRAFGGSLEGRVQADTSGRVPRVRVDGRMNGLDIAQVMARHDGPAGITGRLGGRVDITAAGADADALMRAAHGTIHAAVTDGVMPGLDLVRPVVLAFGRPSGAPPAGSGSAFSRLGGTFALRNSVVSSENLAMESRDFDLAGRGSLNLATGELDARADVVLSRELTEQAGTDFRRYAQEDGRIVVPATIGGTLERPAVSLDVAAAAKRAIGGELRRRTRSLLDELFRRQDDR